METVKAILPSEFISGVDGRASLKIRVPDFDGTHLSFHLGTDKDSSVYLDRPEEGSLMMQEFWEDVAKKIYFDVSPQGDLIAVFPDGYDGFINENGELIIVKGQISIPGKGIGWMIVGSTFAVG